MPLKVSSPPLGQSPFNSITSFLPSFLPSLFCLCHDFCRNPPPMSSLVIDDRKFRAGIGGTVARRPSVRPSGQGPLARHSPSRTPDELATLHTFPNNRGRSTDGRADGRTARIQVARSSCHRLNDSRTAHTGVAGCEATAAAGHVKTRLAEFARIISRSAENRSKT